MKQVLKKFIYQEPFVRKLLESVLPQMREWIKKKETKQGIQHRSEEFSDDRERKKQDNLCNRLGKEPADIRTWWEGQGWGWFWEPYLPGKKQTNNELGRFTDSLELRIKDLGAELEIHMEKAKQTNESSPYWLLKTQILYQKGILWNTVCYSHAQITGVKMMWSLLLISLKIMIWFQ